MGSDENCVFKISFADNIVSEQAFILVEDEPVIYKHHYSHFVEVIKVNSSRTTSIYFHRL